MTAEHRLIMRRRFVVLVTLLLLPAVSANAFVCILARPNGPCIHWTTGGATLRSFLDNININGPLINGTLNWDQNVLNAANDWTAVGANFHFDVIFGGQFNDPCAGTPGACPGSPGENPVFFTDQTCNGMGFGDIVAQTTNCYSTSTGAMVNAPVFVNRNARFDAYDGSLRPPINDMRRVLLHEFGHVLGLDHPNQAGQTVTAIMNSNESTVDRLQSDDIGGILFLYPNTAPSTNSSTAPATGCQLGTAGRGSTWFLVLPLALALGRGFRTED